MKQTGSPLVLEDPMMNMPGAEEFCTHVPCMAGEEVFGSTKRKANLPLGADTSRKHGKKEPQSFSHCGSFDHNFERFFWGILITMFT